MTDIDGHRHLNTLPRGKINPEKWNQQKVLAGKTLPVPFVKMTQKTAHPFISAINDLDIGKPSFLDGKLLFVGDALTNFRPHVASSTRQAAVDAQLVEGLLRSEITASELEDRVLSFAHVKLSGANSGECTSCMDFGQLHFSLRLSYTGLRVEDSGFGDVSMEKHEVAFSAISHRYLLLGVR
jgi:hypothetical protein